MNQISLEIVAANKRSQITFWDDYPPVSGSKTPLAVITDGNLNKLYHHWLKSSFPRALIYIIPPGEKSKSRRMKSKIEDFLLKNNFPRKEIVAFGGGVGGDLAGYKRGVDFWQIPTSLLAMVDSSVGGKTRFRSQVFGNLGRPGLWGAWQKLSRWLSPSTPIFSAS